MRAPDPCPQCEAPGALRALGYYERDVSRPLAKGFLRILIRRFRCMTCGKTVSLLPAFAQPYRIVLNETIEAFAAGHIFHSDVESWSIHLRRYWKRFCFWLPHLYPTLLGIGLSPPPTDPSTCWEGLVTWAGSLSGATINLTGEYQVTLFGRYRCHAPNRCESEF